jgi:hypothetical protein
VRRRHASHITVVLSKAAHSGPSVCLRARAPCPLRVSCPGTDRAERAAQAAGVSVQCKLQVLALPCLHWVQDRGHGRGCAEKAEASRGALQRAIASCDGNPLVDGRLTVRLMRRVDWTCLSELGLAQSEIAFRQHFQHKRTVTSCTVPINHWKVCLRRKPEEGPRSKVSRSPS